jgi:hypothetical protein
VKFELEVYTNDADAPDAPRCESFAATFDYDEDSRVSIRSDPLHAKRFSNVLVLRGRYNELTICVYGVLKAAPEKAKVHTGVLHRGSGATKAASYSGSSPNDAKSGSRQSGSVGAKRLRHEDAPTHAAIPAQRIKLKGGKRDIVSAERVDNAKHPVNAKHADSAKHPVNAKHPVSAKHPVNAKHPVSVKHAVNAKQPKPLPVAVPTVPPPVDPPLNDQLPHFVMPFNMGEILLSIEKQTQQEVLGRMVHLPPPTSETLVQVKRLRSPVCDGSLSLCGSTHALTHSLISATTTRSVASACFCGSAWLLLQ